MATTYTYCHLCEQLCGLAVTTENGRVMRVEPDQQSEHNWRDFCIKAGLAHHSLDHPLRITRPMKRVGDRYVESTYEEAIEDIARRLEAIIARGGPDAVAAYMGNPFGFNFGGSLFLALLLDAIGTKSRYWPGSIDQNAYHVNAEAMYGSPWAHLQPDIDRTDCMLLIGANPKISGMNWIGRTPEGWRRVLDAQKRGAKLIVVDPRRTETARQADVHVAPLPESDWAFLLGLLKVIFDEGLANRARFGTATGLDTVERLAKSASLDDLAARCDVPVATIVETARTFASAPRALAIARTGVGQGRFGAIGLWLTALLNLVTNRIESEGGVYYSVGVVDMLDVIGKILPPSDHKSRVRGSPAIVGFLPLGELPDEINTPGRGQVRALIIAGGNPVVSGPEGDRLDEAMGDLDLVVAMDSFQRESHRRAHWLIPGDHFLEREEINVLLHALNPVPYAQTSRAAVARPAGMKPEWEFLRDLALAMDRPLIAGRKSLNLVVKASRAVARITGNLNHGFSPRWLEKYLVSKGPFRHKDILAAEHGLGDLSARPRFGLLFDRLGTPDRKIQAAPGAFVARLREALDEPVARPEDAGYPLRIISRRRMHMMNSWLSETSMPKMRERPGDRIEMNTADVARLGFVEGQRVRVASATGSVTATVHSSDDIRPGVAVMEHGWGSRTFDPRNGAVPVQEGIMRNVLVSNRDVDPLTGVPRLNGTRVCVTALAATAPAKQDAGLVVA